MRVLHTIKGLSAISVLRIHFGHLPVLSHSVRLLFWDSSCLMRKQSSVTMSGQISNALIDLSGTLHVEDVATPGAQNALSRLIASGVNVKFVTNTTKEPLRELHQRLQQLDFVIAKEDIFTSLTAARALVEQNQLRPLLMLENTAKEDFQGIDVSDPNAVVIGLSPSNFNYPEMNTSFRLLLDGATLIAIHKGRYYKKKDGLHLGPGPFIEALEFATGTKPVVVGKPEINFFEQALRTLGADADEAVMIGDDVRDDVAGAQACGMRGILVKTGKYRDGDEKKIKPEPFAICDNFAQAVELILAHNSNNKLINAT